VHVFSFAHQTIPPTGIFPSLPPPPPNNSPLTVPLNRWMFEKYDGVRAFWNPLKKAFFSRFGNKLMIPDKVVAAMPSAMFLDGELWYTESYSILSSY